MIDLRPYQTDSLEALRQGIREGHKHQILAAPTGSGKTVMGMSLVDEAAKRYSQTAFICDRISLVDQTSSMFDLYGISHGVIQAGHWRWRPNERIQVCSAQTLARRGISQAWKLLIVDEAHTLYKTTVDFIKKHPEIITIGLTATPFTKGLGDIYTNIVNVTTTDRLIEEGWLAPLRSYYAKQIDMTGAKLKFDGEWQDKEMEERGIKIVGHVVTAWMDKTREHFGGPVKTLVFSATVDHGTELCREFQESGFNFQQISYKGGNDKSRRALIEEFRKPDSEIMGLVSCEVLAKGFDVPDVRCGVSCRPYRKSLSSHIQQIGRVMRPHPTKEYALWLDHSGNFMRFFGETSSFFSSGLEHLNDKLLDSRARKEPTEYEKKKHLCGGCGLILPPSARTCPSCGWERPLRNNVQQKAGEMTEIDLLSKAGRKDHEEIFFADRGRVWRQIVHYSLIRKKGDISAAEKFAKAQYRNIYNAWPSKSFESTIELAEPASPILERKIQHQIIRWAMRRHA